jgi:putative ABC transport system permease protein
MSGYVELSYLDLVAAALLVLINAGLSLWLDLRLERQLLVAAVRMVVQLLLIGVILKALFAIVSFWLVLLVLVVMTGFAAHEIRVRQERGLAGWWGHAVGGLPVGLAGFGVTVLALAGLVGPTPWYDPQYAIPLFGMVLGNSMTGISLGLNTLTVAMARERMAVEAQLMLGASRWTALRPVIRRALRSGFMPIINSMAATGVVFLPGMMTGQILAGVDPNQAIRYQLLIMFLIAGATGSGVLLAVFAAAWRLTDERHRLRLDRMAAADERE